MKKKSLTIIATASIMASSLIVPTATAQYLEGQEIEETEGLEYKTLIIEDGEFQTISVEENVEILNYIQIEGIITKISEEMSGYYFVTVDSEDPFGFYFDKKTIILNNLGEEVELKEGMQFTAYVDSSKPMTMIYPPRYSPEVIIAQTEEVGTVQLDQFDENFLNKNKDLVINLNEETLITNLSGNKLSPTDIINKDVIIFYEVVLESYPMQSGPSKVIVLEKSDEELAYQIADIDNYEVNGVKMIPLRLIAEQLDYKVEFTGKGAILSKGAVSFTITFGEEMYGYNKALRYFSEAPAILEYGKTYVPYKFLEELIEVK
ncbi:stalk domain-containing protein [Ureibacillus acetophenoni]|uniref:Copper amine oxidase-like protein n=1 Tax=Ureibacillus acetophenoni TaxID=614649 RepID=A0A285U742_9BACL|nr:stalk domain-containing protein [Ureibacillus acetophenoni]SOC37543.1 copper amine oxidase-like protein [Ureibacillus acetophenoni]